MPATTFAMDGRRSILLLTLACLLAVAGPASAADGPAARWPEGGSTLRAAVAIGAEHWGMTPCRGRVAVRWGALGAATNARSAWANDVDPYTQPSSNTDCAITLSSQVEWDWVKLCSVVVHEVGHLDGHDHVDDPDDVMYPVYLAPVPECATAPEPVETGPPAKAAAKPAAKAKKRKRHAPPRPSGQWRLAPARG
jgi:Matrixin